MHASKLNFQKNLKKSTFLFFACVIVFSLTSCSDEQWDQLLGLARDKDKTSIPDKITFTKPALYPEGVSHDARGKRFLVSSVRFGTIGEVTYNGSYTPFIEDDDLISTIGIKVDESRKRILVAVSDPGAGEKTSPQTVGKLAALGIYDLTTGSRIRFINLGALRPQGGHFANDITLDAQGNAYITDSFSPIIYKVDVNGNASVFFEDTDFATAPGAFGFNGIVYHPSGYLIAGFSRDNKLIRIAVSEPATWSEVSLDTPLMGPDGLLLSKNGKELIVVNNAGGVAPGKVIAFNSENNWESATAGNTFTTDPVMPTTATAYKNEVFVVYAYLNRLFSGVQPPVADFAVQKVPFTTNNY
ncbi:hypothetical protein GXP67_24910 [Rhodocytophaga rosea]|uniref:SMP-30/Gluconolactonase/LRE-like region domain-containing protein n=1 Tax=Rhodocytophaga rosea TaxID=2704465 RepID=A0A6C0GNP9_9BACT|nr:hypothetical protein [Rhodocytophaga rosea]QHT69656.1 hypothetical protein GXP67_24910 [Rhodocytophaga rosea]